MVNKMVDNSAKKYRNKCYVKIVCENYYCKAKEKIIPKIHLIFNSKKDYNKISHIENMIKNYFKIEKKYFGTEKKYFIYNYLKEMIKQLEEYEVMEVYSDHFVAFHLEFSPISDFIHSNIILRFPKITQTNYVTYQDFLEEDLKDNEEYYKENYGENEKYYENFRRVKKLLKEKILF